MKHYTVRARKRKWGLVSSVGDTTPGSQTRTEFLLRVINEENGRDEEHGQLLHSLIFLHLLLLLQTIAKSLGMPVV